MRIRTAISSLLSIAILLLLFVNPVHADVDWCDEYDSSQVRSVVALVHDGVALLEQKGNAAFQDFAVKGSRWLSGDNYLFILDMNGKLVFNPVFSQIVGKTALDFRDISGKPTIQLMVDQVTKYDREEGWVHYLWPTPSDVQPRWKSAYMHLAYTPDGTQYIVGSGVYDAPMERCFAVQQVRNAITYLKQHGVDGFEYLQSRTGPFVWRSMYVFVMDEDGIQHVNPAQPKLIGKNLMKKRDAKGDLFMDRFMKAGALEKPMWVSYWWPKPGHVAASEKATYLEPVEIDGKRYIVGCGIYKY